MSFDGPTWRLENALFATPLYKGKPPATWIAAHAPRMLGLTGRFGDGWYPTQKMTAAEYAEKLGVIRAAALAAGRRFDTFEPALQIQVALGAGRRQVLESLMKVKPATALTLLLGGAVWRKHGLTHPLGEWNRLWVVTRWMPSAAVPAPSHSTMTVTLYGSTVVQPDDVAVGQLLVT